MSRPNDVWSALLAQLGKEPRVAWLGLLGVTLGALCALIGLARGFDIPPEGNLWETATFNGALGVFYLTQATLAPEAGFTERGQRRWGTALIIVTLYAYGIETIQAFRGLDPRLSAVAGAPDQILGGIFFLDAILIMVLFLVLAGQFVRAETTPLRLAVRYGAAACLVSFGVGIWMSIFQGRMVGVEGNLLLIHSCWLPRAPSDPAGSAPARVGRSTGGRCKALGSRRGNHLGRVLLRLTVAGRCGLGSVGDFAGDGGHLGLLRRVGCGGVCSGAGMGPTGNRLTQPGSAGTLRS